MGKFKKHNLFGFPIPGYAIIAAVIIAAILLGPTVVEKVNTQSVTPTETTTTDTPAAALTNVCAETCPEDLLQKPYPDCTCYTPIDIPLSEEEEDAAFARAGDCIDSDGGKDVHNRGSVNNVPDCCSDAAGAICQPSGATDYVAEQYCDTNGVAKTQAIKCPSGEKCLAKFGKCVPSTNFYCSEINEQVKDSPLYKGTCMDFTGGYIDSCNGGVRTTEYACQNLFCVQLETSPKCDDGMECWEGKCIWIPTTQSTTNSNSPCYARNNYLGNAGTCATYNLPQALCERTYFYNPVNRYMYGCKWTGTKCDDSVVCGYDPLY